MGTRMSLGNWRRRRRSLCAFCWANSPRKCRLVSGCNTSCWRIRSLSGSPPWRPQLESDGWLTLSSSSCQVGCVHSGPSHWLVPAVPDWEVLVSCRTQNIIQISPLLTGNLVRNVHVWLLDVTVSTQRKKTKSVSYLRINNNPTSKMHVPMITAMVKTMTIATQLGRLENNATMLSTVLPPGIIHGDRFEWLC